MSRERSSSWTRHCWSLLLNKMNEDNYFVQVQSEIDVRRTLLESSKQTINLLQRYERFKLLRTRKAEATSKLKHQTKELQLLFAKLKQSLPKTGMRVKLKQEAEAAEQSMSNLGKRPAARQNELLKLEAELRDIESKIKGLE